MINKIYSWGMTALFCAIAVIGCEEAEPPPLRGGDTVTILSVTPDALPDGAEQQCAVTVEYTLVHQEYCDLFIAFNTAGLDDFRVHDSHKLTKSGSGSHTFNVAVTSAYWPDGEFQANVYLGDANFYKGFDVAGEIAVTGEALAYDSKTIPLNDDYWTITWELDGGRATNNPGEYTKRIVKGGVLARLSSDPYKNGNFISGIFNFDGWYTDSALTHEYNFAAPVTADLTLFAKWENITVAAITIEDLYGTWKGTYGQNSNSPRIYTLTISANSIRWDATGTLGGYVQYTNVVWTPDENRLYSFTFTGTRTASSNHSRFGTTFDRVSVDWSGINKWNGSIEALVMWVYPFDNRYVATYYKQ
jgi:uncharacterized repeat protein (TIGR02543 family)